MTIVHFNELQLGFFAIHRTALWASNQTDTPYKAISILDFLLLNNTELFKCSYKTPSELSALDRDKYLDAYNTLSAIRCLPNYTSVTITEGSNNENFSNATRAQWYGNLLNEYMKINKLSRSDGNEPLYQKTIREIGDRMVELGFVIQTEESFVFNNDFNQLMETINHVIHLYRDTDKLPIN